MHSLRQLPQKGALSVPQAEGMKAPQGLVAGRRVQAHPQLLPAGCGAAVLAQGRSSQLRCCC